MKTRRNKVAAASSLAVLSAALLAGCFSAPASQGSSLQETGTLTLSVNPEIQIQYNKEGLVTGLDGLNADGDGIVASYQDYIGKECDQVLQDLIAEINEAGYFVEDLDGNRKSIVLQLEPGSVLPTESFLEDMSASTQAAVKELASGVVTIGGGDYDPAYAKDGQPSPYITLEKAKEIALTQANVNSADAVFDDKEFDHDDGTPVFELEFLANGIEYEYDIDAATGQVVKAAHQTAAAPSASSSRPASSSSPAASQPASSRAPASSAPAYNDTDYGPNNDGVTDYNDTDYGPNNDGVTDYNDTDYGPNNDGVTDYTSESQYGNTNYDDGGSNYSADDDDDD